MADQKPYDEKQVLALLAQGSEYAFTQLFDRYRSKVYHVGLRYLKSPPLAEEVVQEVFLKIWNKRADMPQVIRFEGYLISTTKNFILEGMRVLALEEAAEKEFSYWAKPESASDEPENYYQKILHSAIEHLTPAQKQVFRLARIEGLRQDAIAKQLNISPLTVKKHMRNALQIIRQHLGSPMSAGVFIGTLLEVFTPGN